MSNVIYRPATKFFVPAILLMGVIRFILTVSGLPDSIVKYFSMTAVISAGIICFGATSAKRENHSVAAPRAKLAACPAATTPTGSPNRSTNAVRNRV